MTDQTRALSPWDRYEMRGKARSRALAELGRRHPEEYIELRDEYLAALEEEAADG